MTRQQNLPRLGKDWIHLGLVNVADVKLVEAKMKTYRIPIRITDNKWHKKDDPRRKLFKELFVKHGFRRDAMKVMKSLFRAPSSSPEEEDD